ncbi:MAG TPA: Ig-like domain-containing protein, partial [Gammaproteobacteria bacterium]|nr:Ig-like domain-containing protein [Gammaproteobacteria bacterium]
PQNAPAPTSPIKVSSLSPLPDSSHLTLPGSVTAIFDRELDASSVTSASFILDRSGGDGAFGDGNEVVIAVTPTVPLANPATATLDLGAAASIADTYRVRLVGTGGAPILDLDANALDGEFSGTFPSGNGTQGGDFEATFEVVELQPTLQSIQDNLFSVTCSNSGCHSGPAGDTLPSGLDLTSANASFANLVGVASLQTPALERVTPGDPDASYLIQKLEGTGAMERMPFGGPYLEQATIDVIRQWITDGANQ